MPVERSEGSSRPEPLKHRPYKDTFEALRERVVFGAVLPHDLSVTFLGHKTISSGRLNLRDTDRTPVGDFTLPGKSAQIAFTDRVKVAIGAIFNRHLSRTDNMFTVSVPELIEIGYFPYYVPLPDQPLHVRVVYGGANAGLEDNQEVPEAAREALAELLNKHQVRFPSAT